ncbi:MAG: serine/threonine protein kinase [Candidatus Bathyarchaeota archaeon]|nr:serine/threonine protein kinase [Candidatus Bathyarchaeota archaeon]
MESVDITKINSDSDNSADLKKIICYPEFQDNIFYSRIEELRHLGIKSITFQGYRIIKGVRVLGKGYVSIVVLAYTDAEQVALKIRRLDADRDDMSFEGKMLKMVNRLKIGPKLLNLSDNFILMENIEGNLLPLWISEKSERKKLRSRKVLNKLLYDCFKLDIHKLDHGELSNASRHIIVKGDDTPVLLDFESSSCHRKPKNVQCICHYLFLRSRISKSINEILEIDDTGLLIETLRIYKKNQNRKNFKKILEIANVI